jgi:hypothetical protein
MKAQRGSRGSVSRIRNPGTKFIRMVSTIGSPTSLPRKPPAVPNEEEFRWVTESVCVFWRRERSFFSAWNRNVIRTSSVPQPNHYTDCPSTSLHISKDDCWRMNNKTLILFCINRTFKLVKNTILWGYVGTQLVEALIYKPEGRGFDSRQCHWNFTFT